MGDRLDIIIMGATGFTGMHCIPYLHKLTKFDEHDLTWGVAGRSEEKLKWVLEKMGKKSGNDFSKIPVIICDIEDEDSLFRMAERAKLVINCVGPYILYGEKVVDACLKAGSHHIDVSGEPIYIENMVVKKNVTAKEKGVYLISACGFDSIPCDLGIIYVEQNFEGVLNSVVTYLKYSAEGKRSGPAFNNGTWASFVHVLSNLSEVTKILKDLYSDKLPNFTPKLKHQVLPQKSNVVDGWTLPFLGPDRLMAYRSQRYMYEIEKKRPVQVDTLFAAESIIYVILIFLMGVIVFLFSRFECGKKLLLDYPELFSLGLFSKTQPSEETIENSAFEILFHGEGWKEKLAERDDQYSKPCDKKVIARVKGKNPGYGSTCICLVLAAVTILKEKEKLAGNGKGGVYSPGAAFAKTSIIEKLNENEVMFEIISRSK